LRVPGRSGVERRRRYRGCSLCCWRARVAQPAITD
jgi:hypothetical protein